MEENHTVDNAPSEEIIRRSSSSFNEKDLWGKIVSTAKKAGSKVIYGVLLLYYVLKAKETPKGDKLKIIGALGYFILPLDLIPDWIPVAGYTDDLAAITWAIYSVAKNITPEVKRQAKDKLREIFKDYDEKELDSLI